MARRHRRLDGMVRPVFGLLDKSVNSTDVLLGMALGFAGTGLLKYAGNQFAAGILPDALLKGSPLVGGAITAAAAYAYQKDKSVAKANAYALGAAAAGAAVQLWDVLKTQFPQAFGDVVSMKYGSILVNERTPAVGPGGAAYNGLIVDEPSRRQLAAYNEQSNLSALAGLAMGEPDGHDLEGLMGLG